MIKYKKRELLEAVTTLLNVNNFVTQSPKINKREDIINMLAQCQDVALELGNYFETLGESGKLFVSVLEDYCENLYKMGYNFAEEKTCDEITRKIETQLSDLKNEIQFKIPNDRIEMVFFPYKASMWDSLESVWKAADEDPDCDAYVVPIPYFEKNAEGKLAVEHYEGEQFPEEVPVVHYTNYDMVKRRPDVAFIHNPYDQYNYVTSIHPAYYISELKKYANKVAYIPYYVSAETNPDAEEVHKQKEGFILTPGVLHSDFVFVQSENMKRLYVNVLEKNVSGVWRRYWENKIFGLGSPKLDRVHNTKRDDGRLCKGWKALIFDEQGKRKKVILYNISVSDLLNHENMLDKIEDTLAFFEKEREYVLWWRPHPLYESTIKSMRPGLLETYKGIVENYKSKGWGIFDEGEDLEWAIAETDAYYGDRSSVVQLYLEAGKPILYQDTRVKNSVETDGDIPIWARAFFVDRDEVWLMHGKMNLLMKYYLSTETLEIVGCVPDEAFFQLSLYSSMYKEGDKIYLIPCWGKEIAIYDVSSNRFAKIKLNQIEKYENKALFCKCLAVNKALYCIPESYEAIVKIDLCTQEVTYYDLHCYMGVNDVDTYLGDAILIDNKIICPWNRSNQLLIFDLEDEHIRLEGFGPKNRKYIRVGKLKNQLVLYEGTKKQIIMTTLEDSGKEIITDIKCEVPLFSEISKEIMMIDMAYSNEIICIGGNGKILYREKLQIEKKDNALHYDYYCGFHFKEPHTFWYFDTTNCVLHMFTEEGVKRSYNFNCLKINRAQIENIMKIRGRESENEILSLRKWIKERMDFALKKDSYVNIGEKIKNSVKNIFNNNQI